MDKSSLDKDITEFIEGCSVLAVIVSYQTGELVINTINSLAVELSRLPQMRVIIVDNTCGVDCKIIEEAVDNNNWQSWVRTIVSPRNGGFAYGNNLAIRHALRAHHPPGFIWLLNPDTEIYSGASLPLVQFLDENEQVGIVGSCLINHDGNEFGFAFRFPTILSELEHALQFGPFRRLVKNHVVELKMDDEPSQVDWLPGASMMVRFDVFNTAGLFDEEYFLYYEETDFCLNANSAGWSSWYIPSSKVMHIAGQSTGVTGKSASTKRLPEYMFDSRCHYFTKNHGFLYAAIADMARIVGLVCNKGLKLFRAESSKHPPYFLIDSLKNLTIIKFLKKKYEN